MRRRLSMNRMLMTLFAVVCVACNPEAPYTLKSDTIITIKIEQKSAGFFEASYTPSRDAYYLVSDMPVVEELNPELHEKQFMQLALDSAYAGYMKWRFDLLKNGVPLHQIATFKDHCLEYGRTRYSTYFLTPNTDYWVFAFAVDPETNKAVSRLTLDTIHTLEKSEIDCHFRYRVRGMWDYVYPENEKGEILSSFPYSGATLDSVTLREKLKDFPADMQSPAYFFLDSLRTLCDVKDDERILTGICAHNNNGMGGGRSAILFEEGVTYYTGIAGIDGSLNPNQRALYRFTWHEGMDTVFTEAVSLGMDAW